MKRETAELLANTFLDVLSSLGLSIDELMAFTLAAPLDEETKAFAQRVHLVGLARQLEDLPEWSDAEVSRALAAAEQMKHSAQFIRKKLKKILADLPRTPKGPRRIVPRSEERQVCAQFDGLVRDGCDRSAAIERVARSHEASHRTIYRILKKHGRTNPRKPRQTAVK